MKITAITNRLHKLHTQSASFKGKENNGIKDDRRASGVLSKTVTAAAICSCLAGCENTLNDDEMVKKTATLLYPVADNLGQMQHKKVLNDIKTVYSQILPNLKQEKISDTEMQYSYKDKEGNLHAIRTLAVKMPDSKNILVLGKIYNNEKLTGKFKLYADNKKNILEGMLNETPFKFFIEVNEKEKCVRFFDDESIFLEEDYKFDKFGNATQEDGLSNGMAVLLTVLGVFLFATAGSEICKNAF